MSPLVTVVGHNSLGIVMENPITHQLTDEPIMIRNNAGLAALASYGVGTENDPYFIANLQLAVTDEEVAIDISNTDAYFQIKDCRIVIVQGIFALLMSNVTNAVIADCEIVGGSLSIDNSSSCEIIDTTITGPLTEAGIDIWFCRDIVLSRNTIQDTTAGIFLLGSENVWISSNHIFDNSQAGIDIYLSGNTTVHDNILVNNGIVLSLWGGASGQGQSIEGSQYIDVPYNFENNTINGKPLGFFHEESDFQIDGSIYGQVILLNCTDVDVVGGTFANISIGFQTYYCHNCSIESATLANNTSYGIQIFQSEFGEVSNCIIINNGGTGVFIENSNHTLVEGNTINGNVGSGVHLHSSHECRILDNILMGNYHGVGFYDSNNCSVIGNWIGYNSLYGVSIDSQSHQNKIYGNSIGWNIGANGFDDSGYNLWDNGIDTGNVWSDYSGFGLYEIDYYGVDNYPSFLGNPLSNPVNLIILGITVCVIIIAIMIFVWFRKRRQ